MLVRILDFQSLKDVELDVSGFTVLTGRSNIGKSAVVRAIAAALFNRPGDDYIREGEKGCEVTLTDAPSTGPIPLILRWRKGTAATYTINGLDYAKVGQKTPEVLQAAGYRDVTFGSETLRPQVGGQFDGIFLLDRPGSLISDVLTTVSRLAVLLRADRACGTDLKQAKSALKTRQADVAAAETQLAEIGPAVEALVTAIDALRDDYAEVAQLTERVTKIRALKLKRAILTQLPAAVESVTELDEFFDTAAVGLRVGRLQQAAARRRQLAPFWGMSVVRVEPGDVLDGLARLAAGKRAAGKRRGLADLPASIAPVGVPDTARVATKLSDMRALIEKQAAARRREEAAGRTVRAATTTITEAKAALETAWGGQQSCPLCERAL